MTTEDDEKPVPKKSTSRKKRVPSKSKPPKQPGDDEYKRKIQKALEANLIEYAQKKRLSQKQITVINSFIEEHLSCFVLIELLELNGSNLITSDIFSIKKY